MLHAYVQISDHAYVYGMATSCKERYLIGNMAYDGADNSNSKINVKSH